MSQPAAAPSYYSSLSADPDFRDLVELFISELPGRIESLQGLFAEGDMDGLARVAHQLKGAVGSYGFSDATPAAARLESAVKSGEPEDLIREALDELVTMCRRLRAGMPG